MLGERILAELGDPRSNDTLTRWLAHHTARLIAAAEQAATHQDPDADDRAAQARAAILDLWQHRSAWPHGWPPARAATLVRLLDDLPEPDDPGWGARNLLGELQLLHHRMLAALTDIAAAGGTGAEDSVEQRWLATFGEYLTPDEAVLLTRAASAPRRLSTLFTNDRTSVWRQPRRHQRAADAPTAAHTPETDTEIRHDSTADDRTANAPPNPVLEIADAYRDAVTAFFRHAAEEDDTLADGADHHA